MEATEPEGGGRIRRHDRRRVPRRAGRLDPALREAMLGHVARWLAPEMKLLTDRDRDPIHLSWILVGPSDARPFTTLITVGMGSAPMVDPDPRCEGLRWGELFLLMPPDWRFDPRCLPESSANWPFDLTGDLARMPHCYDTVLWSGHTFEYENPSGPLREGLPFRGVVLCETDLLPRDFHVVPIRPDKEIRLHCVLPIHEAELRFAKERGSDELLDRLIRAGVPDVVDCSRPSVCI